MNNPTIAESLEVIVAREGKLTSAIVLEEARDPASPLHSHFEWDDSKAAEAYRLDQARHMIAQVKISLPSSKEGVSVMVRAYVTTGDQEYFPIQSVMTNAEQRASLLRTAWAEFEAFKRKYSHLSELAQVFAAADEVEKAG